MERLIRNEDFILLGKEIHRMFIEDDVIGLDKLRADIHDYLEEQRHTHLAPYIYGNMFRYLSEYISMAIPAIEFGNFDAQIIWDPINEPTFIADKFQHYINLYNENEHAYNSEYWYVYGYKLSLTEGEK